MAPEWRERHERRMRGEAVPAQFAYRGLTRDGQTPWLDVSVTEIVLDGQRLGTQSTIRNIEGRVRAEEERQTLERGRYSCSMMGGRVEPS